MKKPGKKDYRRPAKDSGATVLRVVQEVESTRRQQIQHRTLEVLISAIKAILLSLISQEM